MSCFVHTLQLVVKVFEVTPCYRTTLKRAKAVVKKVNKSCRATERLIQLAGRKLISNCPTRWDSTFYMLSRLLAVKDQLTVVLDELSWDGLTQTQWKHLVDIENLLQPFAHVTNITSSERSTSLAMVVPVIKELRLHLEKVSSNCCRIEIDVIFFF